MLSRFVDASKHQQFFFCLENFALGLFLTTVSRKEAIPQGPAILPRGILATTPTPVNAVPRLAEYKAALESSIGRKCFRFLVIFSYYPVVFNFCINF